MTYSMKENEIPILKSDFIVAPCPKCKEDNLIPYLNTQTERVSCKKCHHDFSLYESVKYRILQRSFKGDYWMAFPFQTLLVGTDLVKTGRASKVKFPIKFKRLSGISTTPFIDIRRGGNIDSTEFVVVSWGIGELKNISWRAIGFTEVYPMWIDLFFEAIWHERNQNYRSAIVSGFSSWEVFINKKAEDIILTKFGANCSKDLLDKTNIHLKRLYLELFDENLMYNDLKKFTEDMSHKRNDVVHKGTEPTFDYVKDFLEIMYKALMKCGVKPADLLKITVIRKKIKEDFAHSQIIMEDVNEKCYIAYNPSSSL